MSSKNISIAITPSHFEVAMFENGEIVGETEWAFNAEQVAEAVKKLLKGNEPLFGLPSSAIPERARAAAGIKPAQPATCVCGTPLDAAGNCPREAELDTDVSDEDTEEFTPLWAEPLVDQPSFPHESLRYGQREELLKYVRDHTYTAACQMYRNYTGARLGLCASAVRYILSQQS